MFTVFGVTRPTVLCLDQGTSGTTALLLDDQFEVVARALVTVAVTYPQPGWVEQDASELADSIVSAARQVVPREGATVAGLTNQRETIVIVERSSGRPVTPAIVWQCRRSAAICERHRAAGEEPTVRERTGLLLDPYFSATKIEWALENIEGLKARARKGELVALTMDAWVTSMLDPSRPYSIDHSNASRTLLYNCAKGQWDEDLCRLFGVPLALLPDIGDSYGGPHQIVVEGKSMPLRATLGDQQAALYGQQCWATGDAKSTYGTGCFLLVNAGHEWTTPPPGVLATVAWRAGQAVTYAFEGSVFSAGSTVRWLVDSGVLDDVTHAQAVATSVEDTGGVVFVPALVGLGSPYWDPHARGAFLGITGGTLAPHLVRAVVEAMAHRTVDVVEEARAGGVSVKSVRVDGGASAMDLLCQLIANGIDAPVVRAASKDATARGAGLLAAASAGLRAMDDPLSTQGREFVPIAKVDEMGRQRERWAAAIVAVRAFAS